MTQSLASSRRKAIVALVSVLAVAGLAPVAALTVPVLAQAGGAAHASGVSTAVTAPSSFGRTAEPLPEDHEVAAQPVGGDYAPDQDVLSYWTAQRMAEAKPYDAGSSDATAPEEGAAAPGSSSSTDPGGMTEPAPPQSQAGATAAGKLFFGGYGADNAYCSASAVSTPTKRVVITAGHCVFDYEEKDWMKNVVFVPDYNMSNPDPAPSGIWTARSLRTFNSWIDESDKSHDVGFVTLNDGGNDNGTVVDAVGGYGIAWDGSYEFQATIFGYPSNKTEPNGRYSMRTCQDSVFRTEPDDSRVSVDDCAFGLGASGGPWLYRYREDSGLGYVRAVTSTWRPLDGRNTASYFTSEVKSMMDETAWE